MPPLITIYHLRPSCLIRNLISPRAKVVPLLRTTSRPSQNVVSLFPLANVIAVQTTRSRAILDTVVLPQRPARSGFLLPIPWAAETVSDVHGMPMAVVAGTGPNSSNIHVRSLPRHHVGKALPARPSAGVSWHRVFWPDITKVALSLFSSRLGSVCWAGFK